MKLRLYHSKPFSLPLLNWKITALKKIDSNLTAMEMCTGPPKREEFIAIRKGKKPLMVFSGPTDSNVKGCAFAQRQL